MVVMSHSLFPPLNHPVQWSYLFASTATAIRNSLCKRKVTNVGFYVLSGDKATPNNSSFLESSYVSRKNVNLT